MDAMQDYGLGGARSIHAFVKEKLETFQRMEISFSSLFELMFREKENILYERSVGYRIETTTYGQAYDDVLRLAHAIKTTLALERGAVVGLDMDNGLGFIESFWAILAAGYRPLLMNRRLPKPTLDKALADTNACAVISEDRTFDCPTYALSALTSDMTLTLPAVFGDEFFIMSSGTTENLKICAYSAEELYYQILESYQIIRACAPIKKHYHGRLKLLAFLPFYHIFGLTAVYMWFAFFSRTFVHLRDMAPDTIVNTIKRHEVTHIFAVPLFWEKVYEQAQAAISRQDAATRKRLQKGLRIAGAIGGVPILGRTFIRKAFRPVREKIFGESVCFCITGGSGIPTAVLTFFNRIGYRLANGYGMTEVGITSVELSSSQKRLTDGFVGKPLAFVEYTINEQGELLVRGKATAKRILENGNPIDVGGWYNTKDLAECVGGRYRILGRRDDLIVARNGENLNPELLEPYFAGEDVAAVALVREQTPAGDSPVLLVSVRRTLSPSRFAAVDERLRQTAASLGLSSLLGRIVYTSDPLIGADEFKCNRTRLAAALEAGELTILLPEAFRSDDADGDEVTEQVRALFAAALGKAPEDIRADADFFLDEGGTSLDYFAMISALQEAFAVPFPADGETGLNTVAQIASFIKNGAQHVD